MQHDSKELLTSELMQTKRDLALVEPLERGCAVGGPQVKQWEVELRSHHSEGSKHIPHRHVQVHDVDARATGELQVGQHGGQHFFTSILANLFHLVAALDVVVVFLIHDLKAVRLLIHALDDDKVFAGQLGGRFCSSVSQQRGMSPEVILVCHL